MTAYTAYTAPTHATGRVTMGTPVYSCTEWDPLEEVVVGSVAGGVFPTWQKSMADALPVSSGQLFREQGGRPLPPAHLDAAEAELDAFAEILKGEGIRVVRPDVVQHERPFETPYWRSVGGLYAGCPGIC